MTYKIILNIADKKILLQLNDPRLYRLINQNYKPIINDMQGITPKIIVIEFTSPYYIISTDKIRAKINKMADFDYISYVIKAFIELALAQDGVVLLHGASLEYSRLGYVFVGPSGIGKSTVINNSSLIDSINVLSDDTAIIRRIGNKFLVYYSVLDKKNKNTICTESFPLRKIYILKQASKTKSTKLHIFDKTKYLLYNDISMMFAYGVNIKADIKTSLRKSEVMSIKKIENSQKLLKASIIGLISSTEISMLYFDRYFTFNSDFK